MENEQVLLMSKLIEFMEEEAAHLDGPYKVAALKTTAAYYENMTHAEGMMAIFQRSFNMLN